MERLTKKLSDGNFTCECGWNYFEYGDGHLEIFNKLGHLEDLEQELGIPLEVLFKALKDGIYRFYEEPEDEEKHIYYLDPIICYDEYKSCWLFFDDSTYNTYYLKDYGKTWWLEKPNE